ncbi:hypothetical protein VNO77_25873 [Canavalia gladiata]|uniref:Pentatricopeptide repeat-containing protein n=1 Tax=Canavalia gladiata TaxID=3824 RepID=A0AAN9KU81_CANGL
MRVLALAPTLVSHTLAMNSLKPVADELVCASWRFLFSYKHLMLEANIKPEPFALSDSECQLTRNEFSSLGHGKYGCITLYGMKKLSFLLRSCVAHFTALQCHAQSVVQGLLPNSILETDLVLGYSKLGLLRDARKVFDKMLDRKNKYSWNILIASYAQSCMYSDALTIFSEFKCCGLRPDHYTLPPLFKASIGVDDACIGNTCHGLVIRLGYEGYVVVANSVLEFYVKFGAMPQACCVFSNMFCKDSVSWNLVISGFGRAGLYSDAMHCFREMLSLNGMMRVDFMTLPSILNACGNEGDLLKGREVHGYVIRSFGFDADAAIGNALIDMYSKCGRWNDSERVFRTMHCINLVTWTTMISCYGVHGKGEESLLLFKKMIDNGFRPNPVTLTAILASCSHSGLIDQGKHIFSSICSDYGFEPSVEHYACMVHLLSRCGYLVEALELLKSMKSSATGSMWGALLAGCVMHKNVKVGEIAAHQLFQLEPNNTSNYIALCGIYQSHGMVDGLSTVREKLRALGLVKSPGCSWIHIAGRAHKFYQGDLSHPITRMISKIIYQISNTQLLTNDLGYCLLHSDDRTSCPVMAKLIALREIGTCKDDFWSQMSVYALPIFILWRFVFCLQFDISFVAFPCAKADLILIISSVLLSDSLLSYSFQSPVLRKVICGSVLTFCNFKAQLRYSKVKMIMFKDVSIGFVWILVGNLDPNFINDHLKVFSHMENYSGDSSRQYNLLCCAEGALMDTVDMLIAMKIKVMLLLDRILTFLVVQLSRVC